MYGALTVILSALALTIWFRSRYGGWGLSETLFVVLLIALVGTFHVWATFASLFLLLALAKTRTCDARRLLFVSMISVPPIWLIAYFLGPLASGRDFNSFLNFDLATVPGRFADSFTGSRSVLLILIAFWVFSWFLSNRSSGYFMDLPAIGTVIIALTISSLFVPIYKDYVAAPYFSLLIVGMLTRWVAGLAVALPTAVLILNAIVITPQSVASKQNWVETTSFAEAYRSAYPSSSLLYVYPDNRDLFHSRFFFGDAPLLPLSDLEPCADRSAEAGYHGLVVINHASPEKQKALIKNLNATQLLTSPTGGVFRVPC